MTDNRPRGSYPRMIISYGSAQPSLVFLILAGIALIIFGAAMFHIMSMPSFEEARAQQSYQSELKSYEEIARKHNMSPAAYKQKIEQEGREQANVRKSVMALQDAIRDNDRPSFDQYFTTELLTHLEEQLPRAYALAVSKNNRYAFEKLLATKTFNCHNNTISGSQAFEAAVNATDDYWLETLLKNNCKMQAGTAQREVKALIKKSKYKHRLLVLPDVEIDQETLDKYFIDSIAKDSEAHALMFLEHGASVNALDRNKQSAVLLSVRHNKNDLAVRLIEAGADLRFSKSDRAASLLARCVETENLTIAKIVLQKDPGQIEALNIGDQLLASLLQVSDKETRFELAKLFFSNGLNFKTLDHGGGRWLIGAIELLDLNLVNLMITAGVNPNARNGFDTALGTARALAPKRKSEELDKIIDLLVRADATDDVLAIIRIENGIAQNATCTLGEKRSYQISNKAKDAIAKNRSSGSDKKQSISSKQEEACALFFGDCVNQGIGPDDCMRSNPVCSDNENPEACCPTRLTNAYFAGRCAGLDVYETQKWIDDL